MAKIMIVEDDRNLLSIYGDRLRAEGHEIITAGDGEEALAVAVKEKPALIISDVMMPKISGFDMLDILRSTPETRNVKIVMMTALSQAEDRERANKLGADKYLVKSQVTLDDVARTVNEIVAETATTASAPSTTPVVDDSKVVAEPVVDDAKTAEEEEAKISSRIDEFLSKNMQGTPAPSTATPQATQVPVSTPVAVPPTEPVEVRDDLATQSSAEPPVSDAGTKPNIFELYEQELAKEAQAKTAEPAETPKA